MRRFTMIISLFLIVFLVSSCHKQSSNPDDSQTEFRQDEALQVEPPKPEQISLCISTLSFERISDHSLQLSWRDETDAFVEEYHLMRRSPDTTETDWTCIATLPSDGQVNEEEYHYEDELPSSLPVQYEYRVDITPSDIEQYIGDEGQSIYASNVLICIDPGHFEGVNAVTSGGNETDADYAEGDFTLPVALELREELKTHSGISAILTRETEHISLGGYFDDALDSGKISLRGEAARDCNLFFSIHTNANLEQANGYPTTAQPTEITKTVVLMNAIAANDPTAISIANKVGTKLSNCNYELGISTTERFQTANDFSEIIPWSDSFNDALNTPGTLCYRFNEDQTTDYYGVLRGAASVNVPGIIVEHAFHTVPAMRVLAASNSLARQWAIADATGIAEGLGFQYK